MREKRSFAERTRVLPNDEVKKKYFLVYEGKDTEAIYFEAVDVLREHISINPLIEVIPVIRSYSEDGWSNPKKILDRMIKNIEELKNILPLINKPIDIHLMVENPLPYIKAINNPNVKYITIHIEINQDINSLIDTIKSSGYKACLAIKPNTTIEEIIPYIEKIDMVLIMSVEPGYGGQKFIPNSVEKLKAIKKINKNILTEVDGGINNDTIIYVKDYTDIVVSGSYIINNPNYNEAIINLKK